MSNNLDGTLLRVDPVKNRVVATIRTGGAPANLAFAFGSVWVGSTSGTKVFRIDPRTSRVTPVESGGDSPSSIEAAAGSLWIANRTSNTVMHLRGSEVWRIHVG